VVRKTEVLCYQPCDHLFLDSHHLRLPDEPASVFCLSFCSCSGREPLEIIWHKVLQAGVLHVTHLHTYMM